MWTHSRDILWMLLVVCAPIINCVRNVKYAPLPGAAVASNAEECAEIGMSMLQMQGSAVDAAIATLLCEGVSIPHSLGIGGGFVATIYSWNTEQAETLNAREVAPGASSSTMFAEQSGGVADGGLAVAVPGEIKGYWEMHQKYGRLKWDALFLPSIKLCQTGILMTPYLRKALSLVSGRIISEPSLAEIFVDPQTNDLWAEGQRFKMLTLATTLETIAKEGADALYSTTGTVLPKLMADLRAFGSIITEEDFYQYSPTWSPPVKVGLRNGLTVYSMPLPASGNVLTFMLSILDGYKYLSQEEPLTWHRIVESFKHGFGLRTKLGDLKFFPVQEELTKLGNKNYIAYVRDIIFPNKTFDNFDHYGANFYSATDLGAAHVSILAPNGDAVAITSTINDVLGAKIRSQSTGIILNNEMSAFSTPGLANAYGLQPSPTNFIQPGKQPLSSMAPTVVVDRKGDVRLVAGAAGGSQILTATVLFMLRTLYFKTNICYSINAPRLHHQLMPNVVEYESLLEPWILEELRNRGHEVALTTSPFELGSVTGILRDDNNKVTAAFDPRRTGSVAVHKRKPGAMNCL